MKFLKHYRNKIDFFFRKNIRVSRKYIGKNEDKEGLFSDLSGEKAQRAKDKEALYLEKYSLENLKSYSTKRNYLENLATIELLETYINVNHSCPKILDIGSKNWFYVFGEYNFFKYNNFKKNITLNGIELDAYRMYSNLYARRDYAIYYSKGIENCNYIDDDLLNHTEKYDYITWFFPFLTPAPLLEWGLPLDVLKPLEMLDHAVNLLNPGGMMIIVNQDENEYLLQKELFDQLKLNYKDEGEFSNSFLSYEHKRFVTLYY